MDSGAVIGSGIGAAAFRGRLLADLRAVFRAGFAFFAGRRLAALLFVGRRFADLRLAPFLARAGAALRLAPLRALRPAAFFALRFAFLGIRPSIELSK
jgi:hypothetical protein